MAVPRTNHPATPASGMSSYPAASWTSSRAAGDEPLPGYRLMEPLGRGGFGEVWKCEAPGGLHKAIKFVSTDPDSFDGGTAALEQEFAAFQHIKTIRHPFFLQLERVELVKNELLMVMELADAQLQDRFQECVNRGLPGIMRDELLGFLADAAEALDVISAKHGLQHLDVKPANLFIIGGHVKVGDYGLVARLQTPPAGNQAPRLSRGLTPRYVAPEVLRGNIHTRSDQYSLALVYQELLTGTYPYNARSPHQLLMQHVTSPPDLSGLPAPDRHPVARALSKNPEERFPSCLAFIQALLTITTTRMESITRTPADTAMDAIRRNRVERSVAEITLSPVDTVPENCSPENNASLETLEPAPPETLTVHSFPILTLPGISLPGLVTPSARKEKDSRAQQQTSTTRGLSRGQVPQPTRPGSLHGNTSATDTHQQDLLTLTAVSPPQVRLNPIYSVVPIARLMGHLAEPALVGPSAFLDAILAHATGGTIAQPVQHARLLANGTWACHFPTTLLPAVAPLKLTTLIEDGWCDEITQPTTTTLVLRVRAETGIWNKLSGKASGAEVIVEFPPPQGAGFSTHGSYASSPFSQSQPGAGSSRVSRDMVGAVVEVRVRGHLFGNPDAAFTSRAMDGIPQLMNEVVRLLQSITDRRKDPRIACTEPVTIYPIMEDGMVQPLIAGTCKDISASGICCQLQSAVPTRYVYVEFPTIAMMSGLAILTRLSRASLVGYGQVIAGRFRTDL